MEGKDILNMMHFYIISRNYNENIFLNFSGREPNQMTRSIAIYFLPKQFDSRLLNNGMGKVTISRLCCHSQREVEVISLPVINRYFSRLIAISKKNKKIIYKCTKLSKVFYKY